MMNTQTPPAPKLFDDPLGFLSRLIWLLWLIPILIFGYAIFTLSDTEITLEWLENEGEHVLVWWLLTTAAGLAVFPLLYRLLPAFADRGYTFARTAGLMMIGFVFWFLASVGLLRNEVGAMISAWIIVGGMSAVVWVYWKERPTWHDLRQWFRENTPLIIITEVLFVVAFLGWAYVRAHNPELQTTEKPMEMAFINGIRNSATFPPKDPWLSGYSISYYYFGYVIAAMLADLSGTTTGIAFSLMNALLFALTAIGALGVVYNLIRFVDKRHHWKSGNRTAAIGSGLLAATLIVLTGSLSTPLVELPYQGYASDVPVANDVVDADYFNFWDLQDSGRLYDARARFFTVENSTTLYRTHVSLSLYLGGENRHLIRETSFGGFALTTPSDNTPLLVLSAIRDDISNTYYAEIAYGGDAELNAQYTAILEYYFGQLPDANFNNIPDWVETNEVYNLLRLYPSQKTIVEQGRNEDQLFKHHVALPDRDDDGILDWDDEQIQLEDTFSWRYWWWWRHSRVVRDRDIEDMPRVVEPIAEFPQFSFLLSDNHPHVLALPFTVMIIGLAAALALRSTPLQFWEILIYAILVGGLVFMNAWDGLYLVVVIAAEALRRLLTNGNGRLNGFAQLGEIIAFERRRQWNFALAIPVFLGLVLFFNTLNLFALEGIIGMLLYGVLAILLTPVVTLLANWILDDNDWGGIIRFAVLLGVLSYLFYLPWYISFSSQASGFFPNVIYPTKSQQFFLQFGLFLIPITIFLIFQAIRAGRQINWITVGAFALIGLLIVTVFPILSVILIDTACPLTIHDGPAWTNEELTERQRDACDGRVRIYGEAADPATTTNFLNFEIYPEGIGKVFERRTSAYASEWFVFAAVAFIAVRLFSSPSKSLMESVPPPLSVNYTSSSAVALLIIAAGLTLAIIPDFIYLQDGFGTRINTIFKLYYQAWTLLSIGTAFGLYQVVAGQAKLGENRPTQSLPVFVGSGAIKAVSVGLMVLLVAGGLLYPYFAIQSRYLYENGRSANPTAPLSLNGEPTIPEYPLAECLKGLEPDQSDVIIAEAPGIPYRPQTSRISMLTGFSTILGWEGHERQWRGDTFDTVILINGRNRNDLLRQLYQNDPTLPSTAEWEQDKALIRELGIDYVVFGRHERDTYGINPPPLSELFSPICSDGSSVIYRVHID